MFSLVLSSLPEAWLEDLTYVMLFTSLFVFKEQLLNGSLASLLRFSRSFSTVIYALTAC